MVLNLFIAKSKGAHIILYSWAEGERGGGGGGEPHSPHYATGPHYVIPFKKLLNMGNAVCIDA